MQTFTKTSSAASSVRTEEKAFTKTRMTGKILAMVMCFCLGVTSLTAQKHKQNLSVKPNKIYSLENDKRHEKELMQQERLRFAPKFNAEQVRKNLKSTDVQERLGAVETAGYFPESNLTAEVENLLITDYSVEVRQQCAQTLQMIGDKNSIPTLVVALKDSDRNVRIFSTLALASLGEKEESSVAVKELWNNGSNNAPFYSCHFIFRDLATTEAINCLSADLNNADKFVAVDAAITLAQIGQSAKAFPFLQQVLTDNDQYIRMAALRGLAYIGDAVSLGLIQTRINDESNLVSEQSMSILKNFTNNSINQ